MDTTDDDAAARSTATLLLVEDNDIDAFLVQRLLRRLDVAVDLVRASNGEEALQLIREHAAGTRPLGLPLITFIDMNMPRMNGLEFLSALDEGEHRCPDGPVFVLTTSVNPRDRDAVLAHPCVLDYLVKPLERATLGRILAEATGTEVAPRKG